MQQLAALQFEALGGPGEPQSPGFAGRNLLQGAAETVAGHHHQEVVAIGHEPGQIELDG